VLGNFVLPTVFQSENYKNLHSSGTQEHFAIPFLASLNSHFVSRWIGRQEPTEWPPRNPDLTLCDFVPTFEPNTKFTDRKWPTLVELEPQFQYNEVLFS
jgi:hypothetical protein